MESPKVGMGALELVGLAAAALARDQTIITANTLFYGLIPITVRPNGKRLVLVDPFADALFEEAIATLIQKRA